MSDQVKAMEPGDLSPVDAALLKSFGLTDSQRELFADALRDAPAGLLEIAKESRAYGRDRGNTGAGLLIHRIRRGDHFDRELALIEPPPAVRRKITGWRYARGSHGETWIRDPEGTSTPPRSLVGD